MASVGGCFVDTHSAPAAGNHEVLGLLVGECDQAESFVSECVSNC